MAGEADYTDVEARGKKVHSCCSCCCVGEETINGGPAGHFTSTVGGVPVYIGRQGQG